MAGVRTGGAASAGGSGGPGTVRGARTARAADPEGSDGTATRPLLAIDTAISEAVIAIGTPRGEVLAADTWTAGYRHGEELLSRIDRLLRACGIGLSDLGAIVVGTGPGAFTGLRVGLSTAKALARGLDIPLVGIPSAAGLLDAAADAIVRVAPGAGPAGAGAAPTRAGAAAEPGAEATAGSAGAVAIGPRQALALLLPAGPSDCVLVLDGLPSLIPGGQEPAVPEGTTVVAVDLPGRAPADAVALGRLAVAGLSEALLRLGAARLAAGDIDDVARVVPEYVTLPRGVRSSTGEMRWSRDRR